MRTPRGETPGLRLAPPLSAWAATVGLEEEADLLAQAGKYDEANRLLRAVYRIRRALLAEAVLRLLDRGTLDSEPQGT